MKKKVILACDHGGVAIKQQVMDALKSLDFEINDLGISSEEQKVDYPDMAAKACEEFKKGGYEFGVVLCGTGIGISIAANKVHGIRCALLYDTFTASMAKKHNNANFIAFGGRVHYHDSIHDMIQAYVASSFEGDRHQNRINKITAMES